jgi:hypothetical protein
MDPFTLAIAGAVATGIATGAGESTGTALATLVSRIRERLGRSGAPASRDEISGALEQEFTRDPEFRQECEVLWNQVQGDSVVNSFTGQAKTVVQARDIHGGLTIN